MPCADNGCSSLLSSTELCPLSRPTAYEMHNVYAAAHARSPATSRYPAAVAWPVHDVLPPDGRNLIIGPSSDGTEAGHTPRFLSPREAAVAAGCWPRPATDQLS